MDDIVYNYDATGIELSMPELIIAVLVVGAILIVLALVITAIFRIEKIVKENEKKLDQILMQQNQIIRSQEQYIYPAQNNNRY